MRATVLLVALAFATLPLAGCLETGDAPGSGDGGELQMRTLAKGQDSGWHVRSESVITSQDRWDRWWTEHTSNGSAPPAVDFAEERVLAITLGDRPDTCHSVEITRVLTDPETGRLVVTAVESGPAPGDGCGDAITQPYHAVAVPNTGDPVTWDVTLWEPPTDDPAPEAGPVAFEVIARSDTSHGPEDEQNETHVVTTEADWHALWDARREDDASLAEEPPAVDFTTHRVVAFFVMKPYTNQGVDATAATRTAEGRLVLEVEHFYPCGQLAALGWKGLFVTVPAGDEPVDLRHVARHQDCSEEPKGGGGEDPNEAPPKPAPGPVDWDRLERGSDSGVEDNRTVIVTNEADWDGLWAEHTAKRMPPPDAPDVDFAAHRVVAHFMGERSNGCHGVDVTGVHIPQDQWPTVVVNVTWYQPPPDAMCTDQVTHPFVMITIPAGDADVVIQGRAETP